MEKEEARYQRQRHMEEKGEGVRAAGNSWVRRRWAPVGQTGEHARGKEIGEERGRRGGETLTHGAPGTVPVSMV
jgi:hypothetical protein